MALLLPHRSPWLLVGSRAGRAESHSEPIPPCVDEASRAVFLHFSATPCSNEKVKFQGVRVRVPSFRTTPLESGRRLLAKGEGENLQQCSLGAPRGAQTTRGDKAR